MYEKRPTHLDLFSGIGGFALAAQWAGFQTVGFCEREVYCQKLLAQHWPGVPIEPDIFGLDGARYRGVDLLTGGFPCQPYSVAGKRKGQEDDRALWPEMLRVIRVSKPTWIVGENVAGLDGLGLDSCIDDLEAGGYEVAPPLEIPACAVGAFHKRMRLWIIANHTGPHVEKSHVVLAARGIFELGEPSIRSAGCLWEPSRETYLTEMAGDVHGVSDWVDRSKALGNAIVPQVAYQILKPIYDLITNETTH